ncbi:mandelate racemase [Sulfolobus sp. A20]|uniref:mandelate racemase/muconate lactonizing enzyme family protein n=1 Tax=Saccharolobus sp. A20 TaxID=1891280 RepID=UPI000845FD27|nr:mandelate racemase/muconate lactonizing enzyme family protein [Sulfolobus sp. A20]TRM73727.1 mandelate racemase/muconate lactonizing enzyme family protein [Sulfolobus sp. A20-N-F8]TRM74058.1 mandelate racemase/muconate lactonizing enzyme family protein [Sulfolobus sp. B5]TRM85852.1 mandelate racemase/muconate lactonizing enzyme family protein [Sulfolobus sp. E3]TRM86129.1 mandelate racemase/muconate lactonizing enzyme family protein [Sulfolobus sp. C3]TRM97846.1 mandelate racemase/muconate 
MELKITDFKVFTAQANFEWTFVKVYSKDLYGVGEAGPAPGLKGMESEFKQLLLGEDAFKINRIEQKLRYATLYSGSTTHHLVAGTIIAIYDLITKYLNIPLYKFLGGDRDEIRVYADAHAGNGLEAINSLLLPVSLCDNKHAEIRSNIPISGRLTEDKWEKEYSVEAFVKRAKDLVNEGYTAIKFDLDIPTPYLNLGRIRVGDLSLKDIDFMIEIIKAIRDSIGNEIDLMVDLHWRYNLNTVLRLCKALSPYRLRWIEDPTPASIGLSNFDELRIIAERCNTPIAIGETLYSYQQFKDLIPSKILVWTPDIAKTGIIEGRRIIELASMYDIEFSPHNIGSPIATMATAHLSSLSNTLGAMEFHAHDLPFWNEIVRPKKRIIDHGFIKLNDEPGLGIDLDTDAAKKYWDDIDL